MNSIEVYLIENCMQRDFANLSKTETDIISKFLRSFFKNVDISFLQNEPYCILKNLENDDYIKIIGKTMNFKHLNTSSCILYFKDHKIYDKDFIID